MMCEFRVIFRAKDYEETVSFYRDGLELPVDHSWDRGPGQQGTVFRAAAGLIEVLALPPGQVFAPAEGLEIGYEVADVDAWYRKAQEKGLPIRGTLADKPWGHRSFSLTDPAGIKVLLYTIIGQP